MRIWTILVATDGNLWLKITSNFDYVWLDQWIPECFMSAIYYSKSYFCQSCCIDFIYQLLGSWLINHLKELVCPDDFGNTLTHYFKMSSDGKPKEGLLYSLLPICSILWTIVWSIAGSVSAINALNPGSFSSTMWWITMETKLFHRRLENHTDRATKAYRFVGYPSNGNDPYCGQVCFLQFLWPADNATKYCLHPYHKYLSPVYCINLQNQYSIALKGKPYPKLIGAKLKSMTDSVCLFWLFLLSRNFLSSIVDKKTFATGRFRGGFETK